MGSFLVEAMSDPTAVMQRAAHYLAADPVQLNLVWSILRQRAESGVPGSYWLLEADGVATGIVLESPPAHGAAISPVQPEEAVCLAEAISGEGHRLTGISGVASTSAAFAGRWTEKTATSAVVEEAQRLYVLDCLCPAEAVPGNLRRAEFFERGLLTEWWAAFQVETGSARLDVSAAVDLALARGRLFVWDHDGPRCVARATEPLGGVSRIGAVFTPPRWRRHGYASACVGALCEWLSCEQGANAVLYAQLCNPGSNAIYRRLGFKAVSEVLAYRFGEVAKHR
jgi:GNAT superfamily N-acetyltransferase